MSELPPPTARYALNLMLDRERRLLMLKRAASARLGGNQWGLPAGKIEAGETPKAAASREMAEEIGGGHQVIQRNYRGPIRDTYYGGQFEIHLFLFDWLGGTIRLNHEHTEYAWVSKESISEFDVMAGIEEDIALLNIWPLDYLNPDRVPEYLKRPT